VTIGSPVPGERKGVKFTRFGESLALGDQGRFVAFWAAWGAETVERVVTCPAEGNKDRRAFCNEVVCPGGSCVLELPAREGLFAYDVARGVVLPVAKAGQDGIDTFLYCKFSGRVPGASSGCGGGSGQGEGPGGPGQGHGGPGGSDQGQGGGSGEGGEGGPDDFDNYEDGELARWRCGANVALASRGNAWFQVAYRAVRAGETSLELWDSRPRVPRQVLLQTGMDAAALQPAYAGMKIASLGIERDGFRKGWMAITASMLADAPEAEPAADDGHDGDDGHGGEDSHADEAEGNAGIYLARVPGWSDMDE
jgi:hypothetical protein